MWSSRPESARGTACGGGRARGVRRGARGGDPRRRLQALHRVLHPGRDTDPDRARGGAAGRGPSGDGGHRNPVPGPAYGGDRRLPGIYGDHRARDPEDAPDSAGPGAVEHASAQARARGRDSARFQQHLRHRHAPQRGRAAGHQDDRGPGAVSQAQVRLRPRVSRPPRRLAGPEGHVWPAADSARARSRARLRGAPTGRDRRDGRLYHRREDPALSHRAAARRPQVLPGVRRRAPLPARCAGAVPGGLRGVPQAQGAHRREAHDAAQCARRARRPLVRRRRHRIPFRTRQREAEFAAGGGIRARLLAPAARARVPRAGFARRGDAGGRSAGHFGSQAACRGAPDWCRLSPPSRCSRF